VLFIVQIKCNFVFQSWFVDSHVTSFTEQKRCDMENGLAGY